MGDIKLTREAIAGLFVEDRDWLTGQPRSLERDHICDTIEWIIRETEAGRNPFEYWQDRAEAAERQLAHCEGVAESWGKALQAAEQRAEQAERDREELAAAIQQAWLNGDHEQTNEEFCEELSLSRETFDRLIKGE